MNFREWINFFEVAEPRKPLSKVAKRTVQKDAGTWKQRGVIEYKFKTKLGNEVKVHFDKKDEKEYDVVFYVNETQYDDASEKTGVLRDNEILSGVLWIIKDKADRLGAEKITFEAQVGKGDTRIVRNLDLNKYLPQAVNLLNKFRQDLNAYQVEMIEPKASVYEKLGRPVPAPKPSVEKDRWYKFIDNFMQSIEDKKPFRELLVNFESSEYTSDLSKYIPVKDLIAALKNLSNAFESHGPSGWLRMENRREKVWEGLVNRYFVPNWNLDKSGTKFILTRAYGEIA